MKIISWNVNGIRAVEKKGFIDWVSASDADVICIQETKAHQGQLSPLLVNPHLLLLLEQCKTSRVFGNSYILQK